MQGGSLPGSSTMWNEEMDVREFARPLWHRIKKLEPSYANDIIQFTMRAKSSWQIRWYALCALDWQIQFLIDEAKSFMGLPTTHQLPQLPLLQLPSASYESPSFFYFEPQFKSSNIPSDGMSMHSLNAQAKVLGSGVPEMHNQRQSHPLGSQRDFFAQRKYRPEFRIYITIKEFSYHRRLTNQNVRDYFKKFGPVINVYIPNEPEKRTFGFVTFQNAGTVGLVLSKGTSHSICGAEVRVKPCLPTKLEQRNLAQKNDHFDNVANRTSCANAIEGHSGEKLLSYDELSQDLLKLQLSEKSSITNTIAPEIDSPLTHNLSEMETESPEGDDATKESNVDESSELPAMKYYLPHDLFSEKQ